MGDRALARASTKAMDLFAKIVRVWPLHSGPSGKALPKGCCAAAADRRWPTPAGDAAAYIGRPRVACTARPRLAYSRAITDKEQAQQGLGIAAQQRQTREYAAARRWPISAKFSDVLSGTGTDRLDYFAAARPRAPPARTGANGRRGRLPARPPRSLGARTRP